MDLLNTIGLIVLLFTEPRLGRGGWNSTIITFGIFIMVQIIFNAGMKIWQEKECERKSDISSTNSLLFLSSYFADNNNMWNDLGTRKIKYYFHMAFSVFGIIGCIYVLQCH